MSALDTFHQLLDKHDIQWEKGDNNLTVCDIGDLECWVGNAMPHNDPTHTKLTLHILYPKPEQVIEIMDILIKNSQSY